MLKVNMTIKNENRPNLFLSLEIKHWRVVNAINLKSLLAARSTHIKET